MEISAQDQFADQSVLEAQSHRATTDDDFSLVDILGMRCASLHEEVPSYDTLVYNAMGPLLRLLRKEFSRSDLFKPVVRRVRHCAIHFRRRRAMFDAIRKIDKDQFPWIRDSMKATTEFKVGDEVESAEAGDPMEICSVTDIYPGSCFEEYCRCNYQRFLLTFWLGGCGVVQTKRGPKLIHLKLLRRYSADMRFPTADPILETAATDFNTSPQFDIGDIVEVARRAWPGINKPGGVGKIVRYHEDDRTYDISYVLGGGERRVEPRFITLNSFLDRSNKRETLGRCK